MNTLILLDFNLWQALITLRGMPEKANKNDSVH